MPSLFRRAFARPPLVGVVALAVLAGACGGGGSSTAPTTLITVPVSTTAPPPGQLQLSDIVVQPSDLPAGWTAKPASVSDTQAADSAAFAQCMGIPNTLNDAVASAFSPDFAKGTVLITSNAVSFDSRQDVQTETNALVDPKAAGCFEAVGRSHLSTDIPSDAAVRSFTLKVTPESSGGPANVVATASGTVVFVASGHRLTLDDQVVFFAAPRIEAQVALYSTGAAVPAALAAQVVRDVSARVREGS